MSPGLNYWIVAWVMMAIAFITAFLAILLGARGLDRIERSDENTESLEQ